jgi:hypothetical protein
MVRRELRRGQTGPDIAAECDKSWLRLRDARTGAIKEFLLGIKVIKVSLTVKTRLRLTRPAQCVGAPLPRPHSATARYRGAVS